MNGSKKLILSILAGLAVIVASGAASRLLSSVDREVVDNIEAIVTKNSKVCLANNSLQSARLDVVENDYSHLTPIIVELVTELKSTREELQELKIEIVKLQEQIKNK